MLQDGLRGFVESVERDVARLSGMGSVQDAESVARLVRSWKKLVDFLALGPAPELRMCPQCGATGMRAATLCGHCWTKLVPPERPGAANEAAVAAR